MTDSLSDDIDSLARCIEIQIIQNENQLNRLPEFEYGSNIRKQQEGVISLQEALDNVRGS